MMKKFNVTVFLVAFIVGFVITSHKSYMGLLEVNEDLGEIIEKYKVTNEELSNMWEQSYDNLLTKYGALLVENDKLEDELDSFVLPEYSYTESEIYLLAQCVEAEAGNYDNHSLSQKYVTQVILNRLHSSEFPDSIKGVIYQKVKGVPQFSVAYNGMIEREVEPETLANVYSVLVHGTDLPKYVCYFYSESVTKNWVNTLNIYDTVQGTVFAYEDKEVN